MAAQLTAMQRVFALEYIICKNGTEAARRAGYKGDDNVLAVTAYDNLRNTKIVDFIDARFAEHGMRANEVIERISEQAAADMGDFIEIRHGIPFWDLEKAAARNKLHLIQSFENTKSGVKLKLFDAQAAQRTLAQHHGLLKTEVEITFAPDLLKRFVDAAQAAGITAGDALEAYVQELVNAHTATNSEQRGAEGG
jgi:hypothetical protein